MKNIDIKEMNKEERLTLAIMKTKNYASLFLTWVLDYDKNDEWRKELKTWAKITKNMLLMRGENHEYITFI